MSMPSLYDEAQAIAAPARPLEHGRGKPDAAPRVPAVSGVTGVLGVNGPSDRTTPADTAKTEPVVRPEHSNGFGNESPEKTVSAPSEPVANRSTTDGALKLSDSAPPCDYPTPKVLSDKEVYVWDEEQSLAENCQSLGKRLAKSGDLYRAPAYAGGSLIFAPKHARIPVAVIGNPHQLASIIIDNIRVNVVRAGNLLGQLIPLTTLKLMLSSEIFLQQFRPVDEVTSLPLYLANFELNKPGYNDDGFGRRVLCHGEQPQIERTLDAIPKFLNAMSFATNADRTNALAFALSVQFARFWPGEKPAFPVTGTKSHSGKDTIIQFATGNHAIVSVSYQSPDWPVERCIVGAIRHNPNLRVICLENARTEKQRGTIASAFVERLVTDPQPFLFSTGTGAPQHIANRFIVAMSTNDGAISEDLMNRACPIHLAPLGNVEDRKSPIGNPKLTFLPQNRARIEAELHGMIEKWKKAGRPLGKFFNHPCINWAQTIGGILEVNGFEDFLGNYSNRRSSDDPIRRALGLLGVARPNDWLTSTEWAAVCEDVGLVTTLIPRADRNSKKGRARGMGIVLTNHREEHFLAETEEHTVKLVLTKGRRRFEGDPPSTRYCFAVKEKTELPVEEADAASQAST